jgi:hypothetical protein
MVQEAGEYTWSSARYHVGLRKEEGFVKDVKMLER